MNLLNVTTILILSTYLTLSIDCKYYHDNLFHHTVTKSTPLFSLYHHNVSSLSAHRIELQIYLESLNFQFDILALTEVGRYNVKNNVAFF